MTETWFYEPARLSTPAKTKFSLKPLDATTWLRSLLSKVLRSIRSTLSNMDTLWTSTLCKSESGVGLIENKDQLKGVQKNLDQLWESVLPRSPLRESRLYSLKTKGEPRAPSC